MKKLIFLCLLGLMLAGGVEASLTKLDGTTIACGEVNKNECYFKIDCVRAILPSGETINGSRYFSGSFDGGKYADTHSIDLNDFNICVVPTNISGVNKYPKETVKPQETATCSSNQKIYNGKCYSNNDYCREKYGSAVQWYDDKNDCDCKTGYEWKVNAGGAICVQIPTKPVEVPKVEAPVAPVVKAPVVVETPKTEPVAVKEAIKPVEPVLEVEEPVVEATSSESVQEASQIETVSEPAVEPVITPEPQKEPNFIVRFFQAIGAWWGGLWR